MRRVQNVPHVVLPLALAAAAALVVGACEREKPTEPELQPLFVDDRKSCDPTRQICEDNNGLRLTEQQAIDTAYYNHYVGNPWPWLTDDDHMAFLANPESVSDAWFDQYAPFYTAADSVRIMNDVDEISSYTTQFTASTGPTDATLASTAPAGPSFLLASLSSPTGGVMRSRGRARARLAGRECDAEVPSAAAVVPAVYGSAAFLQQKSCEDEYNACVNSCRRRYVTIRRVISCVVRCNIAFYVCKYRRNGSRPSGR